MTVFVLGFAISAAGCASVERRFEPPEGVEIEMVQKEQPAPDDGFWLSKETFLMLYEAAERATVVRMFRMK